MENAKTKFLYDMTGKDILDEVKALQTGYQEAKNNNNGLDKGLEAIKDYKDEYQDKLQEFAIDNLPNKEVEELNDLYKDFKENNEGKSFLDYVIDKNGDKEYLQDIQENINKGMSLEEAKNALNERFRSQ